MDIAGSVFNGLKRFLGERSVEERVRGVVRGIGYEVGHEFFMRRGTGKYVDEIEYTQVNPGIQDIHLIQLNTGEAFIIEAFGWHCVAPSVPAPTFTVSLRINQQAVRGYANMVNELCPSAVLDWCFLTQMDVYAHPGAVVRVAAQNAGGAAITIGTRIRGRIVPETYGPAKRP